MSIIERFIEKARTAEKTIVLPEGQDPRVVTAATRIVEKNIAEVIVLGTEHEIASSCAAANIKEKKFSVIDPLKSKTLELYAGEFCELRKKKNMTMDKALDYMKDRLFFGTMMVRKGEAAGMVAGSIASTSSMLRAAFTVIGTVEGIKTGSSCFIMDLSKPSPAGDNVLLYADCGVNPEPDAEQMADIAMATATTYKSLIGAQPRVAFLSFSTNGSAQHSSLEKIREATRITKDRVIKSKLDIIVDGELQADAAIVPSVALKKCPESPIGGKANILIFPDLNSGNICYKLTERLAGADAYGPILQGLARPVNDLSRGCSADDIVGVAAITLCQAVG